MKYLEASDKVSKFKFGTPISFILGMSGTSDHLDLYLRAHATSFNIAADPKSIPFGTLTQYLHNPIIDTPLELFFLLPWDLAPECDWRSGAGYKFIDVNDVLERAKQITKLLSKRPRAYLAYLPAAIPPLCARHSDNDRIAAGLISLAIDIGAKLLDAKHFSVASYLSNGCPINGSSMSNVAEELVDLLFSPPLGTCKVIATDADNTLWSGLVGEDGIENVTAEPDGLAFRHFIYQSVLKRLKSAGALLAIISRNDKDMVQAVLMKERMLLNVSDFVSIHADYGAKSTHLKAMAKNLNLGEESVVFIDDNLVELAEVAVALPNVTCLHFPAKDDDLPAFLNKLACLFDCRQITPEDAQRTEMYQRRLPAELTSNSEGLNDFLGSLNMILTIKDLTNGDWVRAHQLINKTNQFNLNGKRLNESEILKILKGGGRLFTAALEDRSGSHGEILACLIDKNGLVNSLVMSCRVFQRRVEYAFFIWLFHYNKQLITGLDFLATDRNEPIQFFLKDVAFFDKENFHTIKLDQFLLDHAVDFSLFKINEAIE